MKIPEEFLANEAEDLFVHKCNVYGVILCLQIWYGLRPVCKYYSPECGKKILKRFDCKARCVGDLIITKINGDLSFNHFIIYRIQKITQPVPFVFLCFNL